MTDSTRLLISAAGMLKGICLLLIGTLPLAANPSGSWDMRYSNGIAAQVEDKIITLEELRAEVAPLVPQIRANSRTRQEFDQNVTAVTREILRNLVDRVLIINAFNEKGYHIPRTYLDNEYNDYIISEFNGDRSRFLEYLQAQGKSDLQFRQELRERMIVGFMRSQSMRTSTEISPRRVREYYEENRSQFYEEEGVKLRLIMLAPYAYESDDLMMQQAVALRTRLLQGEDFATLAREYSQDDSRRRGGDWGWISRGELLPVLANTAFSLEPGEISEPVRVDEHLYILKVEDKREEGVKDLSRVRSEIEQAISSQLSRQAQERWLERLRRDAYIRYFLEEALPHENIVAPVRMEFGRDSY